ncbi:MAG: homocysteine methyltransferase [Planctomycetes bacterium]|nr:homocysteine methyltransferase [Planctomycetota bacterium]
MPPDAAPVLELLTAFRRSKTMFAAVSLGVFDALSSGPKTLGTLARELEANADALERLLDACAGLSLLTRSVPPDATPTTQSVSALETVRYENTPLSAAYLCEASPHRLTGYLNYSNTVMWKLWEHLEDAVREGTHRWKQEYGWDGPIFSHFFRDERSKREFLMGMHGFGIISSPHVVSAFDLSRFRTLVDLGGATGHLAVAACRRYPHMQSIVFDLPEAVPLAKEMTETTDVAARVAVCGGDFFADPLPTADLFALGRIVHDWTEEKILKLFRRIHSALPVGGGILLAEKLLRDDRSGPVWAQMQNLNMLTCTEGKERTLPQYTSLLTQAGFAQVAGRTTESPLDAVLAIKAD